jgi:hypothetical protein
MTTLTPPPATVEDVLAFAREHLDPAGYSNLIRLLRYHLAPLDLRVRRSQPPGQQLHGLVAMLDREGLTTLLSGMERRWRRGEVPVPPFPVP